MQYFPPCVSYVTWRSFFIGVQQFRVKNRLTLSVTEEKAAKFKVQKPDVMQANKSTCAAAFQELSLACVKQSSLKQSSFTAALNCCKVFVTTITTNPNPNRTAKATL